MNWYEELPFAITVSDKEGKILYMNKRSKQTFEKYGTNLIGKSLFDYHPIAAKNKINEMLQNHEKNAYTIEKDGVKKLIYQCAWYEDENFAGLIEISLPLPAEMPHHVRNQK